VLRGVGRGGCDFRGGGDTDDEAGGVYCAGVLFVDGVCGAGEHWGVDGGAAFEADRAGGGWGVSDDGDGGIDGGAGGAQADHPGAEQ